jgi:HNH endonuclease
MMFVLCLVSSSSCCKRSRERFRTQLAIMTTLATTPITSSLTSALEIDLHSGLGAELIDGRLRRAAKGRDFSNRVLAFYLDELHESGKFGDLGYTCLAQYADQRLGFDPRRARELCHAGRALVALTRIDAACRDGLLCWTKTELLTHGVHEHEQDEWIERALRVGCVELRRMLQRHRKGLSVERSRDGGLPRAGFDVRTTLSAEEYAKLELVRDELMRRSGAFVDDDEALRFIVRGHTVPEHDGGVGAEVDADRAAACEDDETPEWLRRKVLARDGHRCQACGAFGSGQTGSGTLHVHHIVYRSRGGLTREDNLVATCPACHGLIHEGKLLATGRAADGIEFRNRFGEPLVTAGERTISLPKPVLRLLCQEQDECGGRPPPESNPTEAKTLEDEIPEEITGAWFKAHIDRFEPGRDGTWRLIKSVGR